MSKKSKIALSGFFLQGFDQCMTKIITQRITEENTEFHREIF